MTRLLEFRLVTVDDERRAVADSKSARPRLGLVARFRDIDDRLIEATLIAVDGKKPRRGWLSRLSAASRLEVREKFQRLNQPKELSL